jgi:hypothetical protein
MTIRQPGGHIDHLLRQTRMNLIQLSSMADMKASMLVTVASVVMTLAVRYLDDPGLRHAVIVLGLFCLLTVILATYAAMPRISVPPDGGNPDVASPSFNILFFGDFAGMRYDDYRDAMERALDDHNQTYEIMVREVYTLGQFLAFRKYRYVRLAYIAFIAGLVSSVALVALSGAAAMGTAP